ncbi:MAG: hypothetical protein CM1200mP39_16620 [Dehalococcoidia bacterium]|nr:MAG: hypothetical protein CM1200mP39_16620 [Dehalococcoidia bacterium]
MQTPAPVLDALTKGSMKPENHRYPESEGLPEFRTRVAKFYKNRFGVNVNPETEVINLIGAKEGIAHTALCFIDPGIFRSVRIQPILFLKSERCLRGENVLHHFKRTKQILS